MPIVLNRKDKHSPLLRIFTRRKNYERNDWIQFYSGWYWPSFTFALAGYFDNRWQLNFSFIYGKFYIDLPFYSKYDECDPPEYGFYFHSAALWIKRGKKVKSFPLPWQLQWVRTSGLLADGTWIHETKGNRQEFWDSKKWKGVLWSETYPYTYILKDGTIQNRQATLRVDEREWRPLWFKWTKLFAKKRRSIDIDFSDEVGERTGSWKGGTTGCGYDMNDGELPVQTLRRMEKERLFK